IWPQAKDIEFAISKRRLPGREVGEGLLSSHGLVVCGRLRKHGLRFSGSPSIRRFDPAGEQQGDDQGARQASRHVVGPPSVTGSRLKCLIAAAVLQVPRPALPPHRDEGPGPTRSGTTPPLLAWLGTRVASVPEGAAGAAADAGLV